MTDGRIMRTLLVLLSSCAPATAAELIDAPAPDASGPGYTAYVAGSTVDVTTTSIGGAYLGGGGTDIDAGMIWLMSRGGARAANQYGDVVVLRASGSDGYNSYLVKLGANSVTSIVISTVVGANSEYVRRAIEKAEVIFLAGGDQSKYVGLWKGTSLITAVNARMAAGYPIGGTSAGLAVLGEYVYSADNASTTSSVALANPYDASLTLTGALFNVPVLRNVLTDSHFKTRDRMGRLLAFLARLQQDRIAATLPLAIGIDEQSGVGVLPDQSAVVFGPGAGAYFLKVTPESTRLCVAATPLTLTNVVTQHAAAGQAFHLGTWSGPATQNYALSVTAGMLTSTAGSIY